MDATVDEMSEAYQELVTAAAVVVEAQRQSGGEKTAAMDAAVEAFNQRQELFRVACGHAEVLVESIRQHILVDGATGACSSSSSSSSAALALSDDNVLRRILLHLPSAASAAQTSLVSRLWRNIWANLPELRFHDVTDLARVIAALRLRVAPVLFLHIESSDRAPDKIAAVLDLAAPRLAGELCFDIITLEDQNSAGGAGTARIGGAFQIPCFEKATKITIRLRERDHHAIRLPPTGVFAKLTVLRLSHFRLFNQNQCDLGAAVSSEGCPSLQQLFLSNSQVSSNLAIRSESLFRVHLLELGGLQRLTVVAPVLKELGVSRCFNVSVPIADISAPALEALQWIDLFHPSSVQFGAMPCLWRLDVYGLLYRPSTVQHLHSLTLLQHFMTAGDVHLSLVYPHLLVEAVKTLPSVEILSLKLFTKGHAFGPCLFHLLRMCTGIRELNVGLDNRKDGEILCSSGCICHKPQDWETMNIRLNFL